MARASSSLRISTWVRSRGRRWSLGASPTRPASSSQRVALSASVRCRPPAAVGRIKQRNAQGFSATESVWNSRGSWRLRAMPRWCADAPPSRRQHGRRTAPSRFRVQVPHMQLTEVDLPEPFGPIRPTRSPGATSRLMPSSATKPPKRLPRFSTWRSASAISALPAACWRRWRARAPARRCRRPWPRRA